MIRSSPWKINGRNLQITYLERNMIFQTSMIVVHVHLPGCCYYCFLVGICLIHQEIMFFYRVSLLVPIKLILFLGAVWFNVENPSPFPFLLLFNSMFVPNMNEHGIYWNINYIWLFPYGPYIIYIFHIYTVFFFLASLVVLRSDLPNTFRQKKPLSLLDFLTWEVWRPDNRDRVEPHRKKTLCDLCGMVKTWPFQWRIVTSK